MSPSLIVGILSAFITLVVPLVQKKEVGAPECGAATAQLMAGLGGLAYHKRRYVKKPKGLVTGDGNRL